MALPAFVQQTSGVATGFIGSVTSTNFTSSVTTGNAILVALVNQGTSTTATSVSDSSGTNVYTRLKFDTASSFYTAVYICYNATGGANFNVTVTNSQSNDADFVAMEISGVVDTESVSNVSGTSNSTTTPSISTTGATTNANDILIGVFSCEASPMTYTVGASYSNLKQATGHSFSYNIATETQVVSATGSYSASMGGQGTSLGAAAFIIALSNTSLVSSPNINVSNSLSTTESISRTLVNNVNANDVATATEKTDIIRAGARDITISDASSINESLLLTDNDNPAILDNVAHSENLPVEINSFPSISNSSSLTENLALQTTIAVNVSNSLTTSENISQYLDAFFISVSVNSTLSDTNLTLQPTSFINVSDNLTTAESVGFLDTDIDAVSDNLSTSENLSLTLTDNVNVSATATTSENLGFLINPLLSNISDSLSTDENLILLTPTLNISVNDNLTTSDANYVLAVTSLVNVSDSSSLTENIAVTIPANVGGTITTNDNLATTENLPVLTVTYSVNVSNGLVTTENLSLVFGAESVSLTDSLTTTESFSLAILYLLNLSDSLATTEGVTVTVVAVNTSLINLSDTLTTTENASILVPTLLVITSDSTSMTESITETVTYGINIQTTLTTSENVSFLDSDLDIISDNLATSENIQLLVPNLFITTTNSLTTTENISFSEPETLIISDSSSLSENLNLLATPTRAVVDNITTTINSVVQYYIDIDPQDISPITEALSLAIPGAGTLVTTMTDNLAVGENISLFVPTLIIKTSDLSSTTEMVSVVGKTAFINVNDTISTLDVASAGSIGAKVSDTLGHSEAISIHIQSHIQKSHLYKMYRNNNFLGLLQNVISDFGYAQDINTAGSQCNITVALSADTQDQAVTPLQDESGNTLTDEAGNPLLIERQPDIIGNDNDNILIRNDNDIQIYEYSDYWPNGKLMFSGYISTVQAMFGADDGDVINLTALSDGSETANYIIESGTNTDQTQLFYDTYDTLQGVVVKSGGFNEDGQTFTVGGGVNNILAITVKLQGAGTPQNMVLSLFSGPNGTLLASASQTINSAAITDYTFTFISSVPVTAGNQYFFSVAQTDPNDFTGVKIFYQDNNIYAGGDMYSNLYGGAGGGLFVVTPRGYIINNSDLYFKTLTTTNATEATYTNFDPTDILKDVMLNYNNKGGRVVLDPNVSETGLGASYTFNVNTVAEGTSIVQSLAPNGWYWYIDVATKILYFQPTATTAQYKFIRGRHINSLQLKSTIDNLKNIVYFSGGNPGGGNVYVKYTNSASLAANNNRVGMDRISDSNVLDTTTGLALAKDDSNAHMSEEYQTQISIIDTTMDITLPNVGDTIGFEGYGSFIDRLVLQITRITYTPEVLTITVGTLPRRVNQDIQKLKDQLIALQVQNNTASPTTF